MTDFRIKFLGLAAVASLFAGVSFGQTLSCPGQITPTPTEYLRSSAGGREWCYSDQYGVAASASD